MFNSEQLGSVYPVKLELDNSNENIDIMSGFPEVQKKTGKRTVMDYFLDPIVKEFGKRLKEK